MRQRRDLVLAAVITAMTVASVWLVILRPLVPEPVSASPGTASTLTPPGASQRTPTTPGAAATPGPAATPDVSTAPDVSTPPARDASATTTEAAPPSSVSPAEAAASTRCVAGEPARLRIPALGVDAAFQDIGVDLSVPADAQGRRPLGNPTDRTEAGWYAAGPRPGSGTGTVLANGHTYHDGSAIFQESFASQIAPGQRIDVAQVNGSECSYQVQRVWREVDATLDYPTIVASQGLYDVTGPERLFLATCGGPFNTSEQSYDRISLLIATPIDRG